MPNLPLPPPVRGLSGGGDRPDLRLSIRSFVKQLSTECPVAPQKVHFRLWSDCSVGDLFDDDGFGAVLNEEGVVRSDGRCC